MDSNGPGYLRTPVHLHNQGRQALLIVIFLRFLNRRCFRLETCCLQMQGFATLHILFTVPLRPAVVSRTSYQHVTAMSDPADGSNSKLWYENTSGSLISKYLCRTRSDIGLETSPIELVIDHHPINYLVPKGVWRQYGITHNKKE